MKKICILVISIFIIFTPLKVFAGQISFEKSEILLDVGDTEKLKYNLDDDTNVNIIWTSSDTNIATIENGVVKALKVGSTTITATINGDVNNKATCKITVQYIPVKSIRLNKSSLNLLVNQTETLTYTITPTDASNPNIIWTSSNPNVATVENGKITTKSLGTTTITASSDDIKATCQVSVTETIELLGITLNKTNITLKERETETLEIIYNPSNASNKKITWKSSNSGVATIDSNGKITAIKAGTTTITAVSKDGGHVGTCKVQVQAISKNVTSISLDKSNVDLKVGDTTTLNVTINPSYATNKNVIWTSSNPEVAIIENGKITAVSKGETEITAKSEDGNKTAICKVKVSNIKPEQISFNEAITDIYIGQKYTIQIVSTPTNSALDNPIWTSSEPTIATVENGVITALNPGTAIITLSNDDNTLTAKMQINVIELPKEKLIVNIEGYDLNFDENIKNYTLTIKDEEQLTITTNLSKHEVTINGNQKLKNGSIITISRNDDPTNIYVINIKTATNYNIYFIIIICILLIINIVRIILKNKKRTS